MHCRLLIGLLAGGLIATSAAGDKPAGEIQPLPNHPDGLQFFWRVAIDSQGKAWGAINALNPAQANLIHPGVILHDVKVLPDVVATLERNGKFYLIHSFRNDLERAQFLSVCDADIVHGGVIAIHDAERGKARSAYLIGDVVVGDDDRAAAVVHGS